MNVQVLRGYYPIALTPFDQAGHILWSDLEGECDLIARSGAHGLVWPVNDSECTLLSFPERVEGFRRVVDAIGGRIPVVLGVADTSAAGAVALAEKAANAGASAVIAMPPWDVKLGLLAQIEGYYQAIADAAGVPVVVQNLGAPRGSDLSSRFIADLCERIPLVQYVKEERMPQADCLSELLSLDCPDLKGVFSGGWTLTLVAAQRRGCAGVMRGSSVPEVGARIWHLMAQGLEDEARQIEDLYVVLDRAKLAVQTLQGAKELLVMRGIFASSAMRCKTSPRNTSPRRLDEGLLHELRRGLDLLALYLIPSDAGPRFVGHPPDACIGTMPIRSQGAGSRMPCSEGGTCDH
jgi:4-hydroxy-tetrahydrodipicolinate synthase